VRDEARARVLDGCLAARREDEQLLRVRLRGARCRGGGLLEDGVRVGAPDAERRYAGAARAFAGKGDRRGGDEERSLLQRQLGVGALEVEGGRNRPPLQRQRRLEKAGHTRRRVAVADVGLHRAERDRGGGQPVAERLRERGDLDGVAQRRGGAVRLDHPDGRRLHVGHGERLGDGAGLPLHARRGEADLARAVVVDRRAEDQGAHRVAVAQGVGEALEDDDAHARAAHGALRPRVEGAAVAVGRVDAALLVLVPLALRQADGHAPGQRHVALAAQQPRHAMWMATSEVEHEVCTATLGPLRFSL
jgi:hypothetical protein